MGNKAHLGETDFLTALATDEQTKVIVGYLESIASGDAFMKAAQDGASRKPVVVFKAGTTEAGVKAASSHTGSLAGADVSYGAAFLRSGRRPRRHVRVAVRLRHAFAMQPLPKGDRVAIITNAGGPGIMAADAVEHAGMKVGELGAGAATAAGQAARRRQRGQPDRRAGRRRSRALRHGGRRGPGRPRRRRDRRHPDPQAMTRRPRWRAPSRPATAARSRSWPPSWAAPTSCPAAPSCRRQPARLPAPERAVAALRAMVDYAKWLRRPPRMITRFRVNRRRVERIVPAPQAPASCRSARRRPRRSSRLRLQRAARPARHDRRRGGRGGRADRLPGRDEDRLARHHPQVRPRRREAQPRVRRGGARRLRPDDDAHPPARPNRPDRGRLRGAWSSAAARSSSA
jgi:acetate---CoA ligase (ADP-forming)